MGGQIIPLYPDSGTDAARVQGIPVSVVDPTSGQILEYDSTTRQYVPKDYVPKTGGTFTGNVTLNGTANTAPNQTAASGSSLMTRDLVGSWTGHNGFVTAKLDSDFTCSATTPWADVTGLSVSLDANSEYEIFAIAYGNTSSTRRFQCQWRYSGALQTVNGGFPVFQTNGSVYQSAYGSFLSTSFWDFSNTDVSLSLIGTVRTSTAGTLKVVYYKVSGATDPVLKAGTRISFRKLP